MRVSLNIAAIRAEQALRHCGVIRAPATSPGFVTLFDAGIADYRPVHGRDDLLDYRLAR